MTGYVRASLAITGFTLITVPRVACARDPAKAAELFREGRDAMASHDYPLACDKFIESENEDPHAGTLINLAQCEELQGKLATAHQYWLQAGDLARALGDARADYVAAQLARLDVRVPRLTIVLRQDAPTDTIVRRDGIDFGAASLGASLPVETGVHTITVLAPHRAPKQVVVELAEGERREVTVNPGESLVENEAPPLAPAPVGPPASSSPVRIAAYAAGALGVVGLGVGIVSGALAVGDSGTSAGHCDGDVCDPTGTAARQNEVSAGNVATIGFVSGAGLLATAAALRVLSPSRDEAPNVRRNLAYVVGGSGLVGIAAGVVLGLRAAAENQSAGADCNGDVCDHQGAAARRDAIGAGNAATIAFVAGGVLLAGGVAVLVTPKKGSGPTLGALAFMACAGGGGALRWQGGW